MIIAMKTSCSDNDIKQVLTFADPCTVESETQLLTTAAAVRKEGAVILRGGAFKPSKMGRNRSLSHSLAHSCPNFMP